MKYFICAIALVVLATVPGMTVSAEPRPSEDSVFRTELPLQTPRSRDPVLGGSRDKVFFTVWIPDGAKTVRGGICNPFSKDVAVSNHWKAMCRHWQFAYVQTDFDAVKKEEFVLLKTALDQLAVKSGHPEIASMPLCFTGMSRGGGMSIQLAELMPERTIASVPVCLEVGPASEPTRQIPVLTIFGEKDGSQMSKLLAKLPSERKQGARWSIAVQWGRRHEFGQANNLSFVFLDDVIARRLPVETGKPAPLKIIPLEEGWLADPATWGKDGRKPVIAAWNDFEGDREQACWFPSQRVAAVWQAFVRGSKDITITEPAGLGDGQKSLSHPASKPISVKVAAAATATPEKMELWDAQQRLAERTSAPWDFEIALRPGVHALFVIAKTRDSERCSRPHTIVVGD